MTRPRPLTVCAASVLAVGTAMLFHETAHVLVGRMAGGTPTLMTATEVLGEFGTLSPAGFAAFGVSGSVVNLLFCVLGWWALRRRDAPDAFRLTAWFVFAVNGVLVTTKMMGEPLAGFGDWMTVLSPFPGTDVTRGVVALLGTFGIAYMVRRSGAALARMLPPGTPESRTAQAWRLLRIGAAASVVLVLGAAVASPVGTSRSVLLSLGAGLGPFLVMAFGVRFVRRVPSAAAGGAGSAARGAAGVGSTHAAHVACTAYTPDTPDTGERPLLLAAGATLAVLWFVAGPGIALA